MSHEPYAELASGYALTALAAEERARFEGHLQAGCAECEALLTDYTETLAGLARELPLTPPPPAVRARLLQRVAADPIRRTARPARRRPVWPILATASLAAAAALLVYLGVTIGELRQETRARAEELATLRGEVARQRELVALLGAPETRAIALAGLEPSPGASARMWWNEPRRAGYFVASGLPAVPAGKTYQLWVVVSGGKPISAGTFPVDPRGEAALRVGPMPAAAPAEVFAVTLEPAGGLPAPSGPMYLAGKST
jgi:anti-sigma-K factor RskA